MGVLCQRFGTKKKAIIQGWEKTAFYYITNANTAWDLQLCVPERNNSYKIGSFGEPSIQDRNTGRQRQSRYFSKLAAAFLQILCTESWENNWKEDAVRTMSIRKEVDSEWRVTTFLKTENKIIWLQKISLVENYLVQTWKEERSFREIKCPQSNRSHICAFVANQI